MKIQINGFDIELSTDDNSLSVKIMDASGKELSNNIYNQTEGEDINSDENNDVIDTNIDDTDATSENDNMTETSDDEQTSEETSEEETSEEETTDLGESLLIPDFDNFD